MADDSPQSVRSAHASGRSKPSTDNAARVKSANKQFSSQAAASNKEDLFVYIPDLPPNVSEDELEQMIKNRVEATQRMTVHHVECYSKLGVAMIQMMNEHDKKFLVVTVESIVLDKQRGLNISFVDKLELDSYIVLDQNMTKIPSSTEVARRYEHTYKTQELDVCESVSVQFPNIFHIVLSTLDELVKAANSPDFQIENTFGIVYPRAECSFFEDLPPNTNGEKLSSAIATQIGEKTLLATSFYVQHNKQTGNAVVLSLKSAKKWTMEGHLTIDGRNISKKSRLAYRVLVSPVPRDANISRILNNKLFAGRVASHKHINEHLIIELDDMTSYENCLEIGAFRIDEQAMTVTAHTVVSDPDASEIDAVNWYETAMLEIKPDIMTIINNHQHPILRLKWNAENWLVEFRKAEAIDRRSRKYDAVRHLLRVTVMLNTIAIVRKKKYVVDDEEVVLKSGRMRTIGYDHKAKLSYGKKVSQTDLKTPFTSTTVKVVNEDCLVLYEKLISEGHHPVVLNMANATSPGGGYRKGDGAQEENLFRRSDYYQSLDLEVADKNRSERLYCTPKCELKPPTGYAGLYPMEEFGAIYTSGITVFRQTEDRGYAYMKKPLYDVCAIAMAAYRDPDLDDKNMLKNKPAINTHRKIENIFSIAHHHKHDCLVLSALGCGAFRNPPEHVAKLFKSVIYQYAGYFKTIYFAIVDDHNTGNKINPDGNFAPFQKILDNLIVHPPKILRTNGVSGPNRILDKSSDGKLTLSDACISYLPPCQHGSTCRDLKTPQHTGEFSHPSVCSLQDVTSACDQMNDEVHMLTFLHNLKCKHGGECTNTDAKHLSEYDHPEFCKDQSHCTDTSSEHISAYRHLPLCPYGINCPLYLKSKPDHCNSVRHCKSVCSSDNCCVDFHDQEHIKNKIHSFREPCPFTPYNCPLFVKYSQGAAGEKVNQEVESHCLTHSHVCPFGRQCKTNDDGHYRTSIHIARKLCPDGDKCSKLNQEDHLESFSHPGIRDFRLFCREPGYKCQGRFKDQHLRRFRHGENHNHLSIVPCSGFNSFVNFFRNQGHIIRNVNNYVDASNWGKAKISREILDWIRALQPVHRCSKLIFESILVHGHVMSRYYMELLKKPKYVAKAVLQHSRVSLIFRDHNIPEVKQNVNELIKLLVQAEFSKTGADGAPPLDPEHDYNVHKFEKRLKPPLDDQEIQAIHKWATKIARASIELHSHPMGIGFEVDGKLGTDKHIFSILGPHHGYYYGDIVITFKQEIMFHPDANFSIQAGTSFFSSRVYKQRPWWKEPGSEEKHIEHFHNAKLHCSVPRYEYAAAAELIAVTGKSKNSMDVNLDTVIQQWAVVDSHDVFEGHLPQLIPLDYIDNVYIPKNLFQTLNPEAQQSAKAVFKDSLILTDHSIDLSVLKSTGTILLDDSRKPYLKFILDKNREKIRERIESPQISRGIVITVPGTRFEDQIVLPMTISQSYGLYHLDKPQAPPNPEFTYIYWQAMNGDMMLTISNEKIEPSGKDQPNLRCLICYVAEKPSAAIETYHEAYSYLNIGHPCQHYNDVHSSHFKAKSSVFYRGCNTDDFFTFCLKLSHKTGEATLSHAGPNGIYNHVKINYRFDKTELDLSRIEYIHVSAGTQDVPIRNLTINHEPVIELHPLCDKDFKVDTSALLKKRRASDPHVLPVRYDPDVDHKKEPSRQREKRSTSVQPASRPPPEQKRSFFGRIKDALFGSSIKDTPSTSKPPKSDTPRAESPRRHRVRAESPPQHRVRAESPPRHRPRAESPVSDRPKPKPKPSSPPRASSKLPPCHDSVYCLNQNVKDHTEKYAHPCRFNELCRNQVDEPHLIHERHNVS